MMATPVRGTDSSSLGMRGLMKAKPDNRSKETPGHHGGEL